MQGESGADWGFVKTRWNHILERFRLAVQRWIDLVSKRMAVPKPMLITPTSGPINVCKFDLLWATCSPRETVALAECQIAWSSQPVALHQAERLLVDGFPGSIHDHELNQGFKPRRSKNPNQESNTTTAIVFGTLYYHVWVLGAFWASKCPPWTTVGCWQRGFMPGLSLLSRSNYSIANATTLHRPYRYMCIYKYIYVYIHMNT